MPEKKNPAKKLKRNPHAVRFSGFRTKATDLASAKKELYKMIPEAKSVVFLSSRPNQDTLNGWINFETAMTCENFIKNLQKNPKRVINFIKTEEHDKPQRQGILQFNSKCSLFEEWMSEKYPLAGTDINFDDIESTRFCEYKKF